MGLPVSSKDKVQREEIKALGRGNHCLPNRYSDFFFSFTRGKPKCNYIADVFGLISLMDGGP